MEPFDKICEQYEPMITSVIKKAHVYKDFDHYRQCARIALWKAWKNFDPKRGEFAPYAYRTMLTSIYTEISRNNRYTERNTPYEKDELITLSQSQQENQLKVEQKEQLEELLSRLSEEEYQLIKSLYLLGKTYEEIAAYEGKTVASLKKRRQRVMEKLRKMVD